MFNSRNSWLVQFVSNWPKSSILQTQQDLVKKLIYFPDKVASNYSNNSLLMM